MRDFDPATVVQQIKCEKGLLQNPLVPDVVGRFVGSRRIAVIAAVSAYRNETLEAASDDANNLIKLFRDVLKYDEIYVLLNKQVTPDNLRAIFSRYIPEAAKKNETIAVVFAFSGHGVEFDGGQHGSQQRGCR